MFGFRLRLAMKFVRGMLVTPAALLLCGFTLAITYFMLAFLADGESLYLGIDGNLYTTTFDQLFAWSSPERPTAINPYQGMGTLYLPFNVWLTPGYLVLDIFESALVGRTASYLVFLAELFLSIVLLARAWRLPLAVSLVVADWACVAAFPNPCRVFGMFAQFDLNSGVAHFVALGNLMLAAFVLLGRCGRGQNLLLAAALCVPWIYSVLCEPLLHSVVCLSLVYFGLAALCCAESRREVRWKLFGVLVFVLVNLAVGVPEYYAGLSGYPARQMFRGEIYGEIQEGVFASLPFQNGRTLGVFIAMLAGTLALMRFGQGRERRLALLTLLHYLLMIGVSAVFLCGRVNWTYPLPVYLEYGAYSVYAIVAALGGVRAWQLAAAPRLASRQWLARTATWAATHRDALNHVAAGLFPVLATCFLLANGDVPLSPAAIGARDAAMKARVPTSPIVEHLKSSIALTPGDEFRGSVVSTFGESGSPIGRRLGKLADEPFEKWQWGNAASYAQTEFGSTHSLVDLWRFSIPTLEEYGQFVSPPLYFLMSRTLARPRDYTSRNFLPPVTAPDFRILSALGVRYAITDRDFSSQGLNLREELTSRDGITLRLFELPEPNLGHYSPMEIHLCSTAVETVARLREPGFDFRREVVLHEPMEEQLMPARGGRMMFEPGGVRVRGESEGRSLLLLPLQYSNCLKIREAPSAAEGCPLLLRANLAQTAIVFSGTLDVVLEFDYGLANNAQARVEDVRDMDRLELRAATGEKLPPFLHPHAWFSRNQRR